MVGGRRRPPQPRRHQDRAAKGLAEPASAGHPGPPAACRKPLRVPVPEASGQTAFGHTAPLAAGAEGSRSRRRPPARSKAYRCQPGRRPGRSPVHRRADARARRPRDDPALRPCRRPRAAGRCRAHRNSHRGRNGNRRAASSSVVLKTRCAGQGLAAHDTDISVHAMWDCCSARGLRADRRHKLLKKIDTAGSKLHAEQQPWPGVMLPADCGVGPDSLWPGDHRSQRTDARRLVRRGRPVTANPSCSPPWPTAISGVGVIRLPMLTGCRLNEIQTLRWEDVNLEAAEIRLRDGKTGARMMPLSGAAASVLSALPRPETRG